MVAGRLEVRHPRQAFDESAFRPGSVVPDEPGSFDSPSLDGIVPELGYTYANVRVVCYAMNCALGTWGEAPLLLMLEAWKKKKES